MAGVSLTKKPKIIFLDISQTLIDEDVWYLLTSSLHGDLEVHYQAYTKFTRKQISFEEMKKRLFKMWNEGYGAPISKRVLEDILFKVELKAETFGVISDLKNRGYEICLISSYMDLFVKQIAERLAIDNWFANSQFVFDEKGYWIDYTQDTNEAEFKLKKVNEVLKKNDYKAEDCLILGGGYEEVELFKHFPAVAVNTEYAELLALAWREIKYLPTILQILSEFE